jgi:hypothetical protein
MINKAKENNKDIGINIFNILRGLNPKLVITISSYSLDIRAIDMVADTKNVIGKV